MGYIENNLSKDEKIMARIKHSWAGMVSAILRIVVICALATVVFLLKRILAKFGLDLAELNTFYDIICYTCGSFILLLAFIVFLSMLFEIKSSQLVVTNKRVFGRRGFIAKYTTDILLSKIDTIKISNGFLGAILGYGTVEIVSAASGRMTRVERATLRYDFVSNTSEFRKAVMETIDRVKKEEQEAQAKSLSEALKNN